MGSLENGILLKKDQLQNHHKIGRVSSFTKQQKPRSRFPRFLLSKRFGYIQWISTIVVFSLFLGFFQAFLPGSVMERPGNLKHDMDLVGEDLRYLKEIIGELDFGEDVKFEPTRLLAKFNKEAAEVNLTSGFKRGIRFGYRKPKLALVFADLAVDQYQILMATVGSALQEIGYTIEVFTSEDGPAHAVWQHLGVPVTIIEVKDGCRSNVDWLNFMQDPFKSLPLVWTIHELRLATRLNLYLVNGTTGILNDWKKSFSRASVVVFPNYALPVDDRVNGYLFPKEDIKVLTAIILEVFSRGRLSSLAHNVASIGKRTAKNLKAIDAIEGYASLLENILKLPSEVAIPKPAAEIPSRYKNEWRWSIVDIVPDASYKRKNVSSYLDKVEERWSPNKTEPTLKDRSDQPRGTWEDVYRNSRRADHLKNDVHERDDGELERTGQPLCIYEPYLGEGTWPFLHHRPLYRGIGLAAKGRRRGADDVDASSRLSLISNPYYRDVIGEFGAFFAIANRVDRIHKNAWIGFQSWRATARKEALSKTAEIALLKAIEAQEHGDTLYFWARMDSDPRNPLKQDFWSFCDAVNAGNCRTAFSDALKRMYGIKQDWNSLPPMPMDGDTWSVMHSWALPTRSFLEFVMFARMFVDGLDAQMYNEHHRSGHCYLSLARDKHCYSRVLELLVNIWAYHSARHMVYVNPETGMMQEQHSLQNRRGHMWVKFFHFRTLKSMDEDLAEEADTEERKRHWLWPQTGEVFWQGVYEKEREQRKKVKAERKRKNKEKVERIKTRNSKHMKPIDKYVKPPPEETSKSTTTNSTSAVARR
ncbi:NAD-dependent malic enzyme [Bienertia sinuspersici]